MSSMVSQIAPSSSAQSNSGPHRLRGMRVRDEFLCPITYDLLRDPVIAADGNTYERCAIEMWLSKTQTSPLTGVKLAHPQLNPNRTLRKIIEDLISEGGVGLYTKDRTPGVPAGVPAVKEGQSVTTQMQQANAHSSGGVDENNDRNSTQSSSRRSGGGSSGGCDDGADHASATTAAAAALKAPALVKKVRCVDVYREQVLSLTCVGPLDEADWFQKSFCVTPRGCAGGRNAFGRNISAAAAAAKNGSGAVQAEQAQLQQQQPGTAASAPPARRKPLSTEEVVTFKDTNISRQHFEIALMRPGAYAIRDVGSVGGTFLRVQYRTAAVETVVPFVRAVPESTAVTKVPRSSSSSSNSGSEAALDAPAADLMVDYLGTPASFAGLPLRQGAIFVVGSHSFIVDEIDDLNQSGTATETAAAAKAAASREAKAAEDKSIDRDRAGGGGGGDIASVISEVESMLVQIKRLSAKCSPSSSSSSSSSSSVDAYADADADAADRRQLVALQRRLGQLTQQLGAMETAPPAVAAEAKGAGGGSGGGGGRSEIAAAAAAAAAADKKRGEDKDEDKDEAEEAEEGWEVPSHLRGRRCVIRCIAPEASPCIGRSFVIGVGGAVIGRNPGRGVTLAAASASDSAAADAGKDCKAGGSVADAKGGIGADRAPRPQPLAHLTALLPAPLPIAVVDIHMSKEHARVMMDAHTGNFYLCDGSWRTSAATATASAAVSASVQVQVQVQHTPAQASVNGTWLRLSAEGTASPWHALRAGMEVGVSQMRFTVTRAADTIYEEEVVE